MSVVCVCLFRQTNVCVRVYACVCVVELEEREILC